MPWGKPPALMLLAFLVVAMLGIVSGFAIQQWRCSAHFTFGSIATAKPTLQNAEEAFREGNDGTALNQFTELANQNNPVAQYWLGHMAELGRGGPRDAAKAVDLYKKAAAQDDVAAQLRLGEIYVRGDLVAPDFALAKSCLEKAAHHGSPRAAMLLGQMYRQGLGTSVDLKEAYAWSEVAALEGNTVARREGNTTLHDLSPDDQKAAIARAQDILAQIKGKSSAPQAPKQGS
jgi:TPR repeat protein